MSLEILKNDEGVISLQTTDQLLFDWLTIAELTLSVPEKIVLHDSPLEAYKNCRTSVDQARLEITQEQMDSYIARCGVELADNGIDGLKLSACEGYIGLSARVRESTLVADLSARIYLTSDDDKLRISLGAPQVYGYLHTPAPIIAHNILLSILTKKERKTTEILGLGDISLRPLYSALQYSLPLQGWRLPNQRKLHITNVLVDKNGVFCNFRNKNQEDTFPNADTMTGLTALSLAETLEEYRSIDAFLEEGDLENALKGFKGELTTRGPDSPFLIERILSITSSQRNYFVDALELARQVLGRWPDFAPAHAAIASIAVAEGEVEKGAHRYQELSQASATIGDEEGMIRAILAAARLTRQFDAPKSTQLFEQVLESNPDHAESADALSDRYKVEKRWSDLVGLIRKRLTVTQDPLWQARDRARLAEILSQHLQAPHDALDELEHACKLDASTPAFLEQQAEIQLSLSQERAALSSLKKANILHTEHENTRAKCKNFIRGGNICIANKHYEEAAAWFHDAQDVFVGSRPALIGSAKAATGLGNYEEAARIWRELFDAGIDSPDNQARYACELGRVLMKDTRPEEAKVALTRALHAENFSIHAEAFGLLASISQKNNAPEEALTYIEKGIRALELASESKKAELTEKAHLDKNTAIHESFAYQAAELLLQRSKILLSEGTPGCSKKSFQDAFSIAPLHSSPKRESARNLLEQTPSQEGDLLWIDTLEEDNENSEERIYLAFRRVAILVSAQEFVEALAVLKTTLSIIPLGTEALRAGLKLKIQCLAGASRLPERAQVLQQMAQLPGPNSLCAEVYLESAMAWRDLEEQDFCIENLHSGLALLEPHHHPKVRLQLLQALADVSWAMRNWSMTEEAFQSLSEEQQDIPMESLFRWGTSLEKQGRIKEAIALLEPIEMKNEPTQGEAKIASFLAYIYEQDKQFVKAAQSQEKYASVESLLLTASEKADAWYRAGQLYRSVPDFHNNAKLAFNKALSHSSSHLPALDALEKISTEENDFERLAVILSRKVAAMMKHPARRRGLLLRLAELQEHILKRPDVASEIYERILVDSPLFRPALRFTARKALQNGSLSYACDTLVKLSGSLPEDNELNFQPKQLRIQKKDALFSLVAIIEGTQGEIGYVATERLLSEAQSRQDDRLWRALETILRRQEDLTGLAAILEKRIEQVEDKLALPLVLERITILFRSLENIKEASDSLDKALHRFGTIPELTPWRQKLENLASSPPLTKEPFSTNSIAETQSEALNLVTQGQWKDAEYLLSPFVRSNDDPGLLWLHVETCLGLENIDKAFLLLTQLTKQAMESGHVHSEYKAIRRQADLIVEYNIDAYDPHTYYARALALNPSDSVAADFLSRLQNVQAPPLLGPQTHKDTDVTTASNALDLAKQAQQEGRFEQALEWYEQATVLDSQNHHWLQDCADIAEKLGLFTKAISFLESLATHKTSSISTENKQSEQDLVGSIHLHIATLYYDKVCTPDRARASMRLAAESFGLGTKRNLVYRQLAIESFNAGSFQETVDAYEAIGVGQLLEHERVQAAFSYKSLGYENAAIELLESARRSGHLSDDGSLLLIQLHRGRAHQSDYARRLERGATNKKTPIATGLLLESLRIFEHVLADVDSVQRVVQTLNANTPNWRDDNQSSNHSELEKCAEVLLNDEEGILAANLLCRTIEVHCLHLARTGNTPDKKAKTLLKKLQHVISLAQISSNKISNQLSPPRETEVLVRAMRAIVAIETNTSNSVKLLLNIASLEENELHDPRAAVDALSKALLIEPSNEEVFDRLDTICRSRDDLSQLIEFYSLQISETKGERQTSLLTRLGILYQESFNDAPKALLCFEKAAKQSNAPSLEVLERIENLQQSTDPREDSNTDQAASKQLETALTYLIKGERKKALRIYEQVCIDAPQDARAFIALQRMYQEDGKHAKVDSILEKLIDLSNAPKDRASLLFKRSTIARNTNRNNDAAFTFLKESASLDPDNIRYTVALRSLAIARGDWFLTIKLIHREIAVTENTIEKAALHTEIGLIYDEKLSSSQQAIEQFQIAFQLTPTSETLQISIANLYEKSECWRKASRSFRTAASLSSDEADKTNLVRSAEQCEQKLHKNAPSIPTEETSTPSKEQNEWESQRLALNKIGIEQIEKLRDARLEYAEFSEHLGKIEEAITCYENILKEEPDSRKALTDLSKLYVKNGDAEKAIPLHELLLNITPAPLARAVILFRLGEIHLNHLEDTPQAIESFFKAIDMDPNHVPTLRYLLQYYCDEGSFQNVEEIADQLEERKQLLVQENSVSLLIRTALASALCNNKTRCTNIGQSLGNNSVLELAQALRLTFLALKPPDTQELALAARTFSLACDNSIEDTIDAILAHDAGNQMQGLIEAMKKLNSM